MTGDKVVEEEEGDFRQSTGQVATDSVGSQIPSPQYLRLSIVGVMEGFREEGSDETDAVIDLDDGKLKDRKLGLP